MGITTESEGLPCVERRTHPVDSAVAAETLHDGHPVRDRQRHDDVRGEAERDDHGRGVLRRFFHRISDIG